MQLLERVLNRWYPPPQPEDETIERLSWAFVSGGRMLVVRAKKRDVFFDPGGRRQPGVPDEVALARKIRTDLSATLIPTSIALITSFSAPAYDKPGEVMVEMRCYRAEFKERRFHPRRHIAELRLISSTDMLPLSPATEGVRQRLKDEGYIR